MKKMYGCMAFAAAMLLLLGACKKDGKQYTVTSGTFGTGTSLTASADSLVLLDSTSKQTALTFTWTPASFGNDQPVVSYTLQLDVVSDTSGGWKNADSVTIGSNTLTYSVLGIDLNSYLTTLGLSAGTPTPVVARIRANVAKNDNTVASVAFAYSSTVVFTATTYFVNLYVPGSFQGWDPTSAPVLSPVPGSPGRYEGYVYMPGTGVQFKYTNAPDWVHTNYGDGGGGTLDTAGTAPGMHANGGYVEVTANMNVTPATWTATTVTWGLIGDAALPGGWNTDEEFTYNPTTQVWTVTADMVAAGSFKFRANNAWSIDVTGDGNGNLIYVDNPFFTYNNQPNMTVPVDGNYTITLDFHVSGHYTYTIVKN